MNRMSLFSQAAGRYAPPTVPTVWPEFLDERERKDGPVSLIVVDAQPGFTAVDRPTVDAIERQVLLAIENNWWVIVLETWPDRLGHTHSQIWRHLENYNRKIMWVKEGTNGTMQVLWSFDDFRYPEEMVRIVGVNTGACVAAVVYGLLKHRPQTRIRMIEEGLNDEWGKEKGWENFPCATSLAVSSESIDHHP